MKILKYIAVLFISIFISNCDSQDDDFVNIKYIEVQNLVNLPTNLVFNTGDDLNFFVVVPNILTEPGFTTPLNINETTMSNVLEFSYYFEKKNGSEWEYFTAFGPVTSKEAVLNLSGVYVNNTSIQLSQPGQYRLMFNAGTTANSISLISKQESTKYTQIQISTTANNYNTGYYFTVN